MTVRLEKRRDKRTGAIVEFFRVDFTWRHPDGRTERFRSVAPVKTRRLAERWEEDQKRALVDGTYKAAPKAEAPTFEEFAKTFLENYVESNNKASERHTKGVLLRLHLVPFFGTYRLDKIGPERIEAYKAAKLKTHGKKTVNNHLAVLGKALRTAAEWKLIDVAPAVKMTKAPQGDFDFLTYEEAERLTEAAGEWRTMVTVALNTGMRQGELLALRWSDVDLVVGKVRVARTDWKGKYDVPKGGKPREIPLNKRALSALKAHRHLRGELVFTREDGSRLTYQQLYRALETISKRAGLRSVQWHVLRHTFASHLVMRGVPLKAVQELLGHASITMTMRYAHLSPDVRKDAVTALDQPRPANGQPVQTET